MMMADDERSSLQSAAMLLDTLLYVGPLLEALHSAHKQVAHRSLGPRRRGS